MIIPTIYLAYDADFTHDVKIMRKKKLVLLKNNLVGFLKELKDYDLFNLDDAFVHNCLKVHSLDDDSIISKYTEYAKTRKIAGVK